MKSTIQLIIMFSTFHILFAQGIPYNQEFMINTYTEDEQLLPKVCILKDSGFVVCWQSNIQDGSNYGIYGQVFNKDRSKRGLEFKVNSYTNNYQEEPCISSLENGDFIISWESYWQDGDGYEIYAQIFNSDGSKKGSEFRVNTSTESYQEKPDVTGLKNGGFVICWESDHEFLTYYHSVYGQIYNSDGSKKGHEFRINTYTSSNLGLPKLCQLQDSGFVVCWQSEGQDHSGFGISAQIFNDDGTKRGSEFQVNTTVSNDQKNPNVGYLLNGDFVICWENFDSNDRRSGVKAQVFSNEGIKRKTEIQVNTNNVVKFADTISRLVSVSYVSDKEFVICWRNHGIFAQLFTYDTKKIGFEFKINDNLNSAAFPCVRNFLRGGFIICWNSSIIDPYNSDIFSKYYLKEICHKLISFVLVEPNYDTTIDVTEIDIKWKQATSTPINLPWELEYNLYLDEDENFSSPTVIDSIYDTTYTVQNLTPGTTYFWKVLARNIAGDSLWSNETNAFFVDWNATALEQKPNNKLQSFKLQQNYPNPFNPATTIEFEMAKPSHVLLKIFDLQGRQVALLRDEDMSAGQHQIIFNAGNLASGVYFYSIQAGSYRENRKMLLLR